MNLVITQLNDWIEDQSNRYKSILGIPRRKDSTLIKDIEFILLLVENNRNMTITNLNLLLIKKFTIAPNTVLYVRPTLERANLLMKNKNGISLTTTSKNYLKYKRTEILAKGFLDSYFGMLELLLLVGKNQSCTRSDIFPIWVKMYEEEFGERSKSTQRSQFNTIFSYLVGFKLLSVKNKYLYLEEDSINNMEKLLYF